MYCVDIKTSKKGRAWPSQYWKTLFDSIFKAGSKNNPLKKYLSLSDKFNNKYILDIKSRHHLNIDRSCKKHDDSEIYFIRIEKVNEKKDSVFIKKITKINTDDNWREIEFPSFGTIGNKKYEKQIKQNRTELEKKYGDLLSSNSKSNFLILKFILNNKKKDLDNLADAIMPFFNKYLKDLSCLVLIKDQGNNMNKEKLQFSLDNKSFLFQS